MMNKVSFAALKSLLVFSHVRFSYASGEVRKYNEIGGASELCDNPCRPIILRNGQTLITKKTLIHRFPIRLRNETLHFVCKLAGSTTSIETLSSTPDWTITTTQEVLSDSTISVTTIDPVCDPDPCKNGGTCTPKSGTYKCSCPVGYSGKTCQRDRYLLSVGLYGGNHSGEGRVGFLPRGYSTHDFVSVSYSWTMSMSHLVCRDVGFRGAIATLSGDVFPTGELGEVGEAHCPESLNTVTECWYSTIRNRDTSIEYHIAVECCASSNCSSPSGRPLGMESGDISDADIITSSCQSTPPCGHEARLNSIMPWSAASGDQTNPYIQVNLGAYHMITAVVTKGDVSGWVTSFKISYGSEETDLMLLADIENGNEKTFPGNFDATTTVTTSLVPYILAKYIRLIPNSSHHVVTMQFELIGYGPLPEHVVEKHDRDGTCMESGIPLGVENGDIGDESLTASSSEPGNEAHKARLNSSSCDGWVPLEADPEPFLQVDLGNIHRVVGVVTQGHRTLEQWTTSIVLSFDSDHGWTDVDECGSRKIYSANYDTNTPVIIRLTNPVKARKIRIHPQSWKNKVTIRCEILGYVI